MRGSLDRDFNEFIETGEKERVENLLEVPTEYYDNSGSWEPLAGNKQKNRW